MALTVQTLNNTAQETDQGELSCGMCVRTGPVAQCTVSQENTNAISSTDNSNTCSNLNSLHLFDLFLKYAGESVGCCGRSLLVLTLEGMAEWCPLPLCLSNEGKQASVLWVGAYKCYRVVAKLNYEVVGVAVKHLQVVLPSNQSYILWSVRIKLVWERVFASPVCVLLRVLPKVPRREVDATPSPDGHACHVIRTQVEGVCQVNTFSIHSTSQSNI